MGINELNYSQLILLYLPKNKGVKTSMCQVSAFLVLYLNSALTAVQSYRAIKGQSKNKCLPYYITDLDQNELAETLPFVDYTFKLHLYHLHDRLHN